MKRKFLLFSALLFVIIFNYRGLQSLPTGSPSDGRTGSPGDGGKTCAQSGCHDVTATTVSGILSSNIPIEGYTPGSTYTITASIDGSGKKGLCVSPQSIDGTLVGSISAGSGNQVVGLKYITHTTPKTATPGIFTFTWIAPIAGTGKVSFYGSFANNRNMVRKTVYEVNEKLTSGTSEIRKGANLSIFPNPYVVGSDLNLGFEIEGESEVKISLLDISGKEVIVLSQGKLNRGIHNNNYQLPDLSSGIYFMRLEVDGKSWNKKLLIQKN